MPNNIKVERARYGYTQDDLAEMLEINVKTLRTFERDIGTCKVSTLLTLSNIFGVTPEYLIGLTDRRERNYENRN